MVEKQYREGHFLFRHLGQNHYVAFPHPEIYTNSALTLLGIGTEVAEYVKIDFHHRIVKLILIHLTSAYVQTYEQLIVTLQVEATRSALGKYVQDILFRDQWITTPITVEPFGETYEYEPRTWTITLEGSNTNLVIPILYIQKLGEK